MKQYVKTYEAYAYSIKYDWVADGTQILDRIRKKFDEEYVCNTSPIEMKYYEPTKDYRPQFDVNFGEGKKITFSWFINESDEGVCDFYHLPTGATEPIGGTFRTDKFLSKYLEEVEGLEPRKEEKLTKKEFFMFGSSALREIKTFIEMNFECQCTEVEVKRFSKAVGDRPQFDILFGDEQRAKVSWKLPEKKDETAAAVLYYSPGPGAKGEKINAIFRNAKALVKLLEKMGVPKLSKEDQSSAKRQPA